MEEAKANNRLEFTAELLRVQRGGHIVSQELQEAILAWQQAEDGASGFTAAINLWSVWAKESTLPEVIGLPPPYASASVEQVLRPHVNGLMTAEPGSTGNPVLTGAVGVGKTTMLKVCCMLHALRRPDYVVVYWDYEQVDDLTTYPPTPFEALAHVLQWDRDGRRVALTSVTHTKHSYTEQHYTLAGVYCDEVNCFYLKEERFPDDHPRAVWGQLCVRHLISLGKASHCMVMCTGSATELPSMVFPHSAGPFSRYKSFNDSVYHLLPVLPLRSTTSVLEFVASRYGLTLSEGDAHELFNATGGVGRRIHQWWGRWRQNIETTRRLAVEPTHRALTDRTHTLHSIVVAFCGMMYARHGDDDVDGDVDGDERKQDVLPGIPFASISSEAMSPSALTQLAEASIVFKNTAALQYEFVIPAVLHVVRQHFRHNAVARELNGMRTCLMGWDGWGSAGAAAEPLVLRHFLSENPKLPRKQVKLTARDGVVKVHDEHGHVQPLREVGISGLCGLVVCVAKDMGAGAFDLSPAAKAGCYHVRAYQIQLGEYEKYFTPGVLGTQRSKSGNSARDTTTIAGVVACLEVGWCAFRETLQAAFPRTKFRLTEATLLSNKRVDAGALSRAHMLVRTGDRKLKVGPRVTCPLRLVCKTDFYKMLPRDVVRCVLPCHVADQVLGVRAL